MPGLAPEGSTDLICEDLHIRRHRLSHSTRPAEHSARGRPARARHLPKLLLPGLSTDRKYTPPPSAPCQLQASVRRHVDHLSMLRPRRSATMRTVSPKGELAVFPTRARSAPEPPIGSPSRQRASRGRAGPGAPSSPEHPRPPASYSATHRGSRIHRGMADPERPRLTDGAATQVVQPGRTHW